MQLIAIAFLWDALKLRPANLNVRNSKQAPRGDSKAILNPCSNRGRAKRRNENSG